MSSPAELLRHAVVSAMPALDAIAEGDATRARAAGKWSRKEIIGHLIDSASVNHERFVRAQLTDDLICLPYDQNAWVSVQRYHDAQWRQLVGLWALFNEHLARVMNAIPLEIQTRPRQRHNLDQVAFHAVPATEPATLEYFMRDYVAHLEHHLVQIFEQVT
ncbi:MAG: DinB family protein [Gemmatimonadota bacterium]